MEAAILVIASDGGSAGGSAALERTHVGVAPGQVSLIAPRRVALRGVDRRAAAQQGDGRGRAAVGREWADPGIPHEEVAGAAESDATGGDPDQVAPP